jgi:hypothetical protein
MNHPKENRARISVLNRNVIRTGLKSRQLLTDMKGTIPVNTMKAYRGRRSTTPLILILGARWK